jgi:hypothetical protein
VHSRAGRARIRVRKARRGFSYKEQKKDEEWRETFHVSEKGEITRTRVR